MQKQSLIFLPLLLATQLSFAGSYTDTATVTSVDKVYRDHTIREPYQDCYIKEFYQGSGDNSVIPSTNKIMGGILGGLIGNQFGKGDGKKATTIAGTILGTTMAGDNELAKSKTGRVVSKEVCETKYRTSSYSNKRLSHYRVEYEYDGRTFTYTTKNRPYADTVKVRVEVSPK